jgi:protein phosphatase
MVLDLLEWSFLQANEAILRQASEHPELKGMATTAVCALVVNGVLYVAWLGDSRAFLFSGGRLRQLTQDHSEVQRLVNAGLLEAAQARFHPAAHVIYRYLGSKEGFSPSTQTCRISAGDVILLCTDGMTDVLDDQEIAAHIQSCKAGQYPFDDLPRRLARQALEAGTGDNVTVLCCEYSPEPISEPRSFGRTLTGAYPAELAKALHHLAKENRHVQESLIITENQPRARGGRDCQRAGTPALPGLFSRP